MRGVWWQWEHDNAVRAYSMASRFLVWEELPSRINNTGLSFVDCTTVWKCCNQRKNVSFSTHPEALFVTILPSGAPSFSATLRRFLLYITIGGMHVATALVQQTIVVVIPFSALVKRPTCFFFLSQKSLSQASGPYWKSLFHLNDVFQSSAREV